MYLAWEVKYSAVTLPVRGECGGKLKNRFIPIIEIGYGHTDTTDDETNIHYKASAPYFRIGMNYNILFKSLISPVTRMEVYAMASPLSHTTSMLPQWSTRLGETSPFRLPTMG